MHLCRENLGLQCSSDNCDRLQQTHATMKEGVAYETGRMGEGTSSLPLGTRFWSSEAHIRMRSRPQQNGTASLSEATVFLHQAAAKHLMECRL